MLFNNFLEIIWQPNRNQISTLEYVMWDIGRDLNATNCVLGWLIIFAANLTLFHTLTAWICIRREEFCNFTIFCPILCWLVEIYYWHSRSQCSGSQNPLKGANDNTDWKSFVKLPKLSTTKPILQNRSEGHSITDSVPPM